MIATSVSHFKSMTRNVSGTSFHFNFAALFALGRNVSKPARWSEPRERQKRPKREGREVFLRRGERENEKEKEKDHVRDGKKNHKRTYLGSKHRILSL